MTPPIRVVLADDHTLFRAGIRALLDALADVVVVAEAGNAVETLRMVALHQPDIVLTDIAMAGTSGLDVAAQVAAEHSSTRVIVLSMHADEEYVLQALRAGAAGYILKDADTVELGLALRAVMRGETYLSPAVSKQVVSGYVQRTGADDPLNRLSERQRDTLRLIAQGRTTLEIAHRMGISAKTVEKHRAQLMERLDIHDIAGLVRYAIRVGLIKPDA